MMQFNTKFDGINWKVTVLRDDEDSGDFAFDLYHPDGTKEDEVRDELSEKDIYNFIWLPYLKAVKENSDEMRIFHNTQ